MRSAGFPIPFRAIAALVQRDWRRRYRRRRQPALVTLDGISLRLDPAWATPALRTAIYEEWYELVERRIVEQTLRPDDRYLELGGGIGLVATAACRRVGDENVVVYEANPELVPTIEETARRNGFAPEIVNAVLGDAEGQVDFYVHDDFWTSSLAAAEGARVERVPQRSFEAEVGRHATTYLMVDIEGGEIELLGKRPLPAHVRALCLELHPEVTGSAAIRGLLMELLGEGFALDLQLSAESVVFMARSPSPAD